MENKEFYSPKEIAELLGKSDFTVRTWIKAGKLKALKVGQWRIPKDSLQEFLSQGESKERGKE